MATLKIGNISCFSKTSKLTTPSIIISKQGQSTSYVPLAQGNENAEVRVGNYLFKLNKIKVTKGNVIYRAVSSARYSTSIDGVLTATLWHSGAQAYWDEGVSRDYSFVMSNAESRRWNYGITFSQNPNITGYDSSWFYISDVTTTGCTINATDSHKNIAMIALANGNIWNWNCYVKAEGVIRRSYYADEYRTATVSNTHNYGYTFASAPSLSVNNGCSVWNNSGNSSCTVSKTLGGTVSHGSAKTVSQAYTVSVTGSI